MNSDRELAEFFWRELERRAAARAEQGAAKTQPQPAARTAVQRGIEEMVAQKKEKTP